MKRKIQFNSDLKCIDGRAEGSITRTTLMNTK